MKIAKLSVGQVVYSVEKTKMGNTTLSTTSVFSVYVKEIDPEQQWVLASWNGNPARKYFSKSVSKWREKKPVLVACGMRHRLATRDELKAMETK